MWTQNATNSTPLYARSTATVNMSNHVGFQHFPGVDCYSHQGQLLPAGCWIELTETKTWIKHTCMPYVNAKCNKLDAPTCICTIHCHCEHVKPCWLSTFSWSWLLQPPGTAATSWMLKRVDRNENLNHIYLHAMWMQNATNSTPLYARSTATVNMSNHVGFQHFPGVDCYSHQGQLLPAGCWKGLTETKTWIKHTCMPYVNAKCNKLDAPTCICTIHCRCEHVKPCWFSAFSWSWLLQPPGTAATSWMLKRVDRNENLNQTYTCMPCERKMQQTRRLNLHNPLPLWTCQTMLVFNMFRFFFKNSKREIRCLYSPESLWRMKHTSWTDSTYLLIST